MKCSFMFLGAVRIGDVDSKLIINPTKQELQQSTLNLVITCTERRVGMCLVMNLTARRYLTINYNTMIVLNILPYNSFRYQNYLRQ